MATTNFNDTGGNDFKDLPEDRYSLECINSELKQSKAGNPKITATFKVTEGEFTNRRLFSDFSLMPKALFHLKNFFDKAGVEVDGEYENEDLVGMVDGCKVTAYQTMEAGKTGKKYPKLANWGSLDADEGGALFS